MQLTGTEFWMGMGYTLLWLVGFFAVAGLLTAVLIGVARIRNGGPLPWGGNDPDAPSGGPVTVITPDNWREFERRPSAQPALPPPVAPPPALPRPLPAIVPEQTPTPPPHSQQLTASERRHTILVGAEGEGKTQTQIAFLVGDIAHGAQVVWASTNMALHHHRDQPTDLRPIAHRFEHTRDKLEIMAVLQWAADEVDRRMPCYHADVDHGHPIVIHVDELGGLYRTFGETLVHAMRNIAEQGRKVDVFLFLVAHNALKEATGLDAALKPLFKTRLLGTVDQATWTALVGPGVRLKRKPSAWGMWHQPDTQCNVFEVAIRRPDLVELARLGARRAPGFASILEAAQPYRERLLAAVEEAQRRSRGGAALALPPGVDVAPALAAASAPPGPWEPTELHLQVRRLVEDALPEIRRLIASGQTLEKARELTRTSQRGLARQLQLSGGGGAAAVTVGEAIRDWETYAGVRLFAVPQLAPEGRSEHPERPEHITPAA